MENYAKKTFLALKNPYGTVERTYPGVIDRVRWAQDTYGYAFYTGYKWTESIPESLIKRLEDCGFLKHTRDRMAIGGRAVDLQLVNPLTGRWMSGSSSGTALNVFYRINDLGVGTDGGGSVLAPAAALNLYGFISPLIGGEHMKAFEKISTDGIVFSPSVGFITRDMDVLEKAVEAVLEREEDSAAVQTPDIFKIPSSLDIYGKREDLISWVEETVRPGMILQSEEGPVDVYGFGDSIFGQFDKRTMEIQRQSGKGLMRVANMCGVSAMVVPGQALGSCTLLLCDSNPDDIMAMLMHGTRISSPPNALVERYFGNLNMYFES